MGFLGINVCIPPLIMSDECRDDYYEHRETVKQIKAQEQAVTDLYGNLGRTITASETGVATYSDAASTIQATTGPLGALAGVAAAIGSAASGVPIIGGLFGGGRASSDETPPAPNAIQSPFGSATLSTLAIGAIAVALVVRSRR